MEHYSKPDSISIVQALSDAQRIAFAPFIFQATVAMRDLGILEQLAKSRKTGLSSEAISLALDVSDYGVKVLLDFGLSIGLVWKDGDAYVLTKTGYCMVSDEMTRVNLEFSKNFCYDGLRYLKDSVVSGKPEGLKVFGDWDTLYPGLSSLPSDVKKSWFEFDHFYSDSSFDEVLPVVFEDKPSRIMDVGGNTGKWALKCLEYCAEVSVTIMDLPQQLAVSQENINKAGYSDRFTPYSIDLLDEQTEFVKGADVIWMSQFLDCFSEDQILNILQRTAAVMTANSSLYVMELFWDRQVYEAGAFSLNAISLYFTAMANGNSRMYHSKDMLKLIQKAGLYVVKDVDDVGSYHTLLKCKKIP